MTQEVPIDGLGALERIGAEQKPVLISDPEILLARWEEELEKVGPGDPVEFRTMFCYAGEVMRRLGPLLKKASANGASVTLTVDQVSYLLSRNGLPSYLRFTPYPGSSEIAEDYRRNKALLDDLGQHFTVVYSGPDSLRRVVNPFGKGNHAKFVRIGNVGWVLDKNLEDKSFFEFSGFAMEIHNPEMVKRLAWISDPSNFPIKDDEFKLESDPQTRILVDAGIPKSSKIYDETLRMTYEANDFIGMSLMYGPDGELLEELMAADRRGTEIEILATKARKFKESIPQWGIMRVNQKMMLSGDTSLVRALAKDAGSRVVGIFSGDVLDNTSGLGLMYVPNGTHSKHVITSRKVPATGEIINEVMFGTHNNSYWGVKAGTGEIAVVSTNPDFVDPIMDFHKRMVESARTGIPMHPVLN